MFINATGDTAMVQIPYFTENSSSFNTSLAKIRGMSLAVAKHIVYPENKAVTVMAWWCNGRE